MDAGRQTSSHRKHQLDAACTSTYHGHSLARLDSPFHFFPAGQKSTDGLDRYYMLTDTQRHRTGVDGKQIKTERRVLAQFEPMIFEIQRNHLVRDQPGTGKDRQWSQVDMDLVCVVDTGNVARQHA